MRISWLTAFLDLAPDEYDDGVRLGAELTGYAPSAPRGPSEEFVTLVPPDGDAFLKAQRLGSGPSRLHLDVHVDDPGPSAREAQDLGARVVEDNGDDLDYVVMQSPGGLTFCFVSHPAAQRPRPTAWPGGHTSLLDQVCVDIPAEAYDAECAFWHRLTGWERRSSSVSTTFSSLVRPQGVPLRLLLQQLDEPTGRVRAHLDWSTSDLDAEVERHVAAGATVVGRFPVWTVLRGAGGLEHCVTRRDPATGLPPGPAPAPA